MRYFALPGSPLQPFPPSNSAALSESERVTSQYPPKAEAMNRRRVVRNGWLGDGMTGLQTGVYDEPGLYGRPAIHSVNSSSNGPTLGNGQHSNFSWLRQGLKCYIPGMLRSNNRPGMIACQETAQAGTANEYSTRNNRPLSC